MFNILVHFIIINFKFEKQKLFFRLIFSFILGKYSIMFKLHLNVIFLSGMIYDYLTKCYESFIVLYEGLKYDKSNEDIILKIKEFESKFYK
jgi:hypothetical protein